MGEGFIDHTASLTQESFVTCDREAPREQDWETCRAFCVWLYTKSLALTLKTVQ